MDSQLIILMVIARKSNYVFKVSHGNWCFTGVNNRQIKFVTPLFHHQDHLATASTASRLLETCAFGDAMMPRCGSPWHRGTKTGKGSHDFVQHQVRGRALGNS